MSTPSGYPATGKLVISRTNNLEAATWVGPEGQIWFDVLTGVLRLGDGVTPGGIIIGGGGSGKPAGPITSIQFNANGNALGGNASFTFDEANANVHLNGNIFVGNTGGHIFAQSGMFLNDKTIAESYTLDLNYNAVSGGPVTIVGNAVIDIPVGQRWTVV